MLRSTVVDEVSSELGPAAVEAGLQRVLRRAEWSPEDWAFVDQVSKKLDVTRRLHTSYSKQWSKASTAEIDEAARSVLAVTICNAFYLEFQQDPASPMTVKRLNVALKAIDYLEASAPEPAKNLRDALAAVKFAVEARSVSAASGGEPQTVAHTSGILPLTVLFAEGPIARAYLETIKGLGFRPRKIVHLVSSVDVATRKDILSWLPTTLREPIAAGMQRSRMFHWPNAIARGYPNEVSAVISSVADKFDFAEETLRAAQTNKPLVEYSPSVETLLIRDLKDPVLFEYLDRQTDKEYLFTGGGIVPQSLLDAPGSRFIHVHPGFLPDIRGADGLLWSMLTRGRPSASAFYMAPGIDTGDILTARWLPEISVAIGADIDVATRYRMAYAFVDPWVRCCVLRRIIESQTAFGGIPAMRQSEREGCTYHFMHDHVRALALKKLFTER